MEFVSEKCHSQVKKNAIKSTQHFQVTAVFNRVSKEVLVCFGSVLPHWENRATISSSKMQN